MVDFPIPIGFALMMQEIAEGIGEAGRILPERSRSEVGALAVKSASVDISFELSAEARSEATGTKVGGRLGVRTFLFSTRTLNETYEETARNTGRITLEIVAIIEPEAREGGGTDGRQPVGPPVGPPKVPPDTPDEPESDERKEAARLLLAIARMREALPELDISDVEKQQVAALIDMAAAQVAAGNHAAARDIITQLAPGFAALGRAAEARDSEKD